MSLPAVESVRLVDATLSAAGRTPGVSLSPAETVEVARALDAAGVPVVEAGRVGADGDEALRRVVDADLEADVTCVARGVRADLRRALEAGVDGVHLVAPAGEDPAGADHAEVVDRTAELVEYAVDHGLRVEVLAEDASRAAVDDLADLLGAALDAGAERVCYCDTAGVATPERVAEAVDRLAALGPTAVRARDDMGLATANVHAALRAGADAVHATVTGVGERAGVAALEEVAVALDRGYGVGTVELDRLYDLATTVADATGVPLAPTTAVVGENAFTHESGAGVAADPDGGPAREPYPPETVGRERRLAFGADARRAGVRAALAERGVELTDAELDAVVERAAGMADRGKRVTDADLLAVAEDVRGRERDRHVELCDLTATSGAGVPSASVRLRVGDEERVASGTGAGPVDAAVAAVREALGDADADLEAYHVDAVTGGTDAVVTVEVEVSRGDRSVTVAASDDDITRASVTAMVDALDRLLARGPDPTPADD